MNIPTKKTLYTLNEDAPIPQELISIFSEKGAIFVRSLVHLALDEDAPDLTAEGIFQASDTAEAFLVARENTFVVGLPLIPLIFSVLGLEKSVIPISYGLSAYGLLSYELLVEEGSFVQNEQKVARIQGSTSLILKLERVLLNLVTHMSGIANLTSEYVKELQGTGVKLLDTRKTTPGHRYLEKYAVRMGGAYNHRMDLSHMLMIKNNHIDAAGSIKDAVHSLREMYCPCPSIVVECRNKQEILESIAVKPERILLDNMDVNMLQNLLPLIPSSIEAEISGGVNISNIRELALSSQERPADYISVGRITHSAPIADFSLRISRNT